ncbi:glycosyltransferase family A protein [Exiguobacterium sp. s146]|uniref:glycosyltransferase family 2 protein n=1 Tax=Exiguobacterium sp. s146 TaxID=2751223 RepID=UPI001BE69219|nr:glycosyltransferase family A protein [Exiguobacterium sp. s146]
MKKLVSIIVPVYNSENFLFENISSILNQTYYNIEVLLINDGSSDRSLSICKELAQKDQRIFVINQENKGVSAARNKGLEIAQGHYILFVDSDDILEKNMIMGLLRGFENNIDLVICGYNVQHLSKEKKVKNEKIIFERKIVSVEDISRNYWEYFRKGAINPLWNKLFKSSIIKNEGLKFPENIKMGEDGYFVVNYLKSCQNIMFTNDIYYNYMVYPYQSSQKIFPDYYEMMRINFGMIESFLNQYNGLDNEQNFKYHQNELFKVLKHSIVSIEKSKQIDKKHNIKYILNENEVTRKISYQNISSKRNKLFLFFFKRKNTLIIRILISVENLIFLWRKKWKK